MVQVAGQLLQTVFSSCYEPELIYRIESGIQLQGKFFSDSGGGSGDNCNIHVSFSFSIFPADNRGRIYKYRFLPHGHNYMTGIPNIVYGRDQWVFHGASQNRPLRFPRFRPGNC